MSRKFPGRVINIFGSPRSGKSTLLTGLAYQLKKEGKNVEVLVDPGKDIDYSTIPVINRNSFVFGEILDRLSRLVGYTDYIITDCPLLMCLIIKPTYFPSNYDLLVKNAHDMFNNVNIILPPVYRGTEQSNITPTIHGITLDMMRTFNEEYKEVSNSPIEEQLQEILSWIG